MVLTTGSFEVRRRGGQDPKREAQEAAARGDWRPTDQMIRKADPDYVRRFVLGEARKLELRRLYRRAVLLRGPLEHGTSRGDRAVAESLEFWAEYAALDDRWIGDTAEIKAAVAKES